MKLPHHVTIKYLVAQCRKSRTSYPYSHSPVLSVPGDRQRTRGARTWCVANWLCVPPVTSAYCGKLLASLDKAVWCSGYPGERCGDGASS
jgi:hypothetical protein